MNLGNRIDTGKIGLKQMSVLLAVLTALCSVLLFFISYRSYDISRELQQTTNHYIESQLAAARLKQGSDNLSKHVRSFVVTGKIDSLDYYFTELLSTMTYDNAYHKLQVYTLDTDSASKLELINDHENTLKQLDARAIQLAMEYYNVERDKYSAYLNDFPLTNFEKSLSPEDKKSMAVTIIYPTGNDSAHYGNYDTHKRIVDNNIEILNEQLASSARKQQQEKMSAMQRTSGVLRSLAVALLLLVMFDVVAVIRFVVSPLIRNISHINKNEFLEESGVEEMKYLATSYNEVFARVNETHRKLSYEASHDNLTGLYNRQAYFDMNNSYSLRELCLLHIDIDDFKNINDTYGHDVGDKVLCKVASTLLKSFRTHDLIYRLGGDEFVAILVDIVEENADIIRQKVKEISDQLKDDSDGVPAITISVGGAFAKGNKDIDLTYKYADEALYMAKDSGKDKVVFYTNK